MRVSVRPPTASPRLRAPMYCVNRDPFGVRPWPTCHEDGALALLPSAAECGWCIPVVLWWFIRLVIMLRSAHHSWRNMIVHTDRSHPSAVSSRGTVELGDICSLKRAVVQHLSPSCVRTTLNSVNSSSASKCLRGMGYVAIQPHMGLVTERSFVAGQSSALLVRFHLRVVVRLEAGTSWLCRSVMVAVHPPKKKKRQCIPSPAVSTPSTPNRPPTLSTP